MFLPTYSPDLNPIELLFAKLKARLKHISATTLDTLGSAIHDTLKQVALSDLIGWFKHAVTSFISAYLIEIDYR